MSRKTIIGPAVIPASAIHRLIDTTPSRTVRGRIRKRHALRVTGDLMAGGPGFGTQDPVRDRSELPSLLYLIAQSPDAALTQRFLVPTILARN
jgi:hypothetical protein